MRHDGWHQMVSRCGVATPIKHLAGLTNGCTFRSEDWSTEGTPIIRIENLNGSPNFNRIEVTVDDRYRVRAGDLLFSWSGNRGTSFGPHMWDRDGDWYLNQHIFKVSERTVVRRWLYWALKAATAYIEQQTSGMIGMVHVTKEELGGVPLPVPSLGQQRAIADYLDAETACIDALIAKKQELIELLDERIDASIMQIVGESQIVDPTGAPLADLRRLLRKVERPATTEAMITAFRDGQVTTRTARGKDGFTNSWTDGSRVQGVQRGDVVVHGLDGFSGAIGDSEADGICSPVYHVCEPVDGGDSAFYGRMLRLLALTGYLGNFAVSTRERAVDFRNWDLFGRIPIPVVDVSVQRAVGDRIRALRPLVELVRRSEALAVERKNALITRVVTGELAVT